MSEPVKPKPIPTSELREKAFTMLCEFTRTHPEAIAELTNYGYGAWLLTELSREAWRCAQSGQLMQLPLARKALSKPGPGVEPVTVHWGQWLPDDVANAYQLHEAAL